MDRLAAIIAVAGSAAACGSSNHHGTPGDGAIDSVGSDTSDGPASSGWGPVFGARAIAFMEDSAGPNANPVLYRFEDLDGDGDYNEAGERTIFYNQVGELRAINGTTLIAVKNTSTVGGVLWIQDLNANGTALDAGETHAWYSGGLPGGGTMPPIQHLTRTNDGAVYVVAAGSAQTSVYRLSDDNANGNANDTGECTLVGQMPAGMTSTQVAVDGSGDVWFAVFDLNDSNYDLYRMHAGTTTLVIDHTLLLAQYGMTPRNPRLATLADGSIFFVGTYTGSLTFGYILAALRDMNHDGQITLNEVQMIWSYDDGDFFSAFDDFNVVDDGSVIALEYNSGEILRMVDGNADGTFMDRGETYVLYDPYFANANGASMTNNGYSAVASTK
jgi:hypothetical protein